MSGRNGNGTAAAAAAVPAALPPATGSEAPASVTIRATLRGYDVMLTLRGSSGADVLPKTLAALDWLASNGAQPPAPRGRSGRPPADPNAPRCPDHGAPMVKGRSGYYCPRKAADGGYCRRTA